jgi:hypothetical protein
MSAVWEGGGVVAATASDRLAAFAPEGLLSFIPHDGDTGREDTALF